MEEINEAEAHINTEAEAEEAKADSDENTEFSEQPDENVTENSLQGAPEQYEDFIVPGQKEKEDADKAGGLAGGLRDTGNEDVAVNINIDPQVMDEFKERARELNLSQEEAQNMFDIGSKAISRAYEQQMDAWSKTRERWQDELRTDNEFGGRRFNETVERANRTLRKYGDETWINELTQTGFGDNAGLVRLLARVDKVLGEDMASMGDSAPANISREIGDSWYKRR